MVIHRERTLFHSRTPKTKEVLDTEIQARRAQQLLRILWPFWSTCRAKRRPSMPTQRWTASPSCEVFRPSLCIIAGKNLIKTSGIDRFQPTSTRKLCRKNFQQLGRSHDFFGESTDLKLLFCSGFSWGCPLHLSYWHGSVDRPSAVVDSDRLLAAARKLASQKKEAFGAAEKALQATDQAWDKTISNEEAVLRRLFYILLKIAMASRHQAMFFYRINGPHGSRKLYCLPRVGKADTKLVDKHLPIKCRSKV